MYYFADDSRRSLKEKVAQLRQERLAAEANVSNAQDSQFFQHQLSQLRRQMLMQTIEGLKRSLEDQSATLKQTCLEPVLSDELPWSDRSGVPRRAIATDEFLRRHSSHPRLRSSSTGSNASPVLGENAGLVGPPRVVGSIDQTRSICARRLLPTWSSDLTMPGSAERRRARQISIFLSVYMERDKRK